MVCLIRDYPFIYEQLDLGSYCTATFHTFPCHSWRKGISSSDPLPSLRGYQLHLTPYQLQIMAISESAETETLCKASCWDLNRLGDKLKACSHSGRLFQVENEIESLDDIASEIVRATGASKDLSGLREAILECGKQMKYCLETCDQALIVGRWTTELETQLLTAWGSFTSNVRQAVGILSIPDLRCLSFLQDRVCEVSN
jgi:hypothetical protein